MCKHIFRETMVETILEFLNKEFAATKKRVGKSAKAGGRQAWLRVSSSRAAEGRGGWKIHERCRWHCDYAKNLLTASAKMDRHARGSFWRVASATAFLRNTRSRATPLPLRVIVVFVFVVCSKCRRRVCHRHPVVVLGIAITQQINVARCRKTR